MFNLPTNVQSGKSVSGPYAKPSPANPLLKKEVIYTDISFNNIALLFYSNARQFYSSRGEHWYSMG